MDNEETTQEVEMAKGGERLVGIGDLVTVHRTPDFGDAAIGEVIKVRTVSPYNPSLDVLVVEYNWGTLEAARADAQLVCF